MGLEKFVPSTGQTMAVSEIIHASPTKSSGKPPDRQWFDSQTGKLLY